MNLARLLVIDDDVQVRAMLRQMLERAGYRVMDAPNGLVGIELHRQTPAEVIITDIIMPDHEGLETIMGFRREFNDVKIIGCDPLIY